jgi:hypothetical protein
MLFGVGNTPNRTRANLVLPLSTHRNRAELLRLAARLEHILLSLEDSKQRDVIHLPEYNDALTALFECVEFVMFNAEGP